MKIFKLKLPYFKNKSIRLKTVISLVLSLFCLLVLNAQNESNIKLKVESGILWASDEESSEFFDVENLGLFLRIEPTLKTSKNTFLGLRIGASVNTQKIKNHDPLQFDLYRNISTGIIQFIDVDNSTISFVPTFNYHFGEDNFRPYFSIGLGYYFLTNYTDVSPRDMAIPSEDLLKVSVKNKVGVLLRGGLDFDVLIIGLEFNYIPEADIEIPNGQKIGTVENSYIGLSVAYAVGLGKRSE